jgi:phage terminase small subunit
MTRTRNKALTARQQVFVEEYLKSLNAAGAAKLAGFHPKNGTKLMRSPAVKAAIDAAKIARSEATGIDAEWVLREAVGLYQRCIQEIRPALHPKSRKQMKDAEGNPLYTFNASVAARALELVGKHVAVGAFEERLQITGPSIEELLNRGRARVAQQFDASTIEHEPVAQLPAPRKPRLPLPADGATLVISRKED